MYVLYCLHSFVFALSRYAQASIPGQTIKAINNKSYKNSDRTYTRLIMTYQGRAPHNKEAFQWTGVLCIEISPQAAKKYGMVLFKSYITLRSNLSLKKWLPTYSTFKVKIT